MVDYIALGSFKNANDRAKQIERYMNLLKQRNRLDNEQQDRENEDIRNRKYGIRPIEPLKQTEMQTQKQKLDQLELFLELSKDVMADNEARKYATIADPATIRLINLNWSKIEKKLKEEKQKGIEITADYLNSFIIKEFADKTSDISRMRYTPSSIVVGEKEEVPPTLNEVLSDPNSNINELNTALRIYLNETFPTVWTLEPNSRRDEKKLKKHYVELGIIKDDFTSKLGRKDFIDIIRHESLRKAPSKISFLGPPVKISGTPLKLVRTTGGRIYGRGIRENTHSDTYCEFGKYKLHMPSLKNNILSLKYKSRGVISSIPKQIISPEFTEFLIELIREGKINNSLYKTLNQIDKKLFFTICKKSQIDETLGITHNLLTDDEEEKLNNFIKLKGEIMSGNNNPQLLRELRSYVLDFYKDSKLRKDEAFSLLSEISVLL